MAMALTTIEQQSFHRLGPPAPMDEDYWPMVNSSAMTAFFALVSQVTISVYLALQWNIPVELRMWNKVFPYTVFMTTRERFEELLYWSLLLSAVMLAIYSVSSFVTSQRLQVQAGRLTAWLDITLLGATVLMRQYFWNHDIGSTNLAWVLVIMGVIGFGCGAMMIRSSFYRRRRLYGTHYSHIDRRFV